ncbi:MAG: P-loop NTPase fold protein [Candidatus Angelobacter sp.]
MSAPLNSKSSSADASPSGGKRSFYLRPRTKILILAGCLTLMIAASVYAVLQPLNPDPLHTELSDRFWYPRETNPYARLQAVHCANDYACRLNSVAVNGTDNQAEVWAVGNLGLVLHRKAGDNKWEQLKITAKEEDAATPQATPTPVPRATPNTGRQAMPTPTATPAGRTSSTLPPASTPTPTPVPTPAPTAVSTPAPGIVVPNLIGLRLDEAQKMAAGSGFQLDIEYEKGSEPNPVAQQGPPPDLRVIRQTPERNPSRILVTLGRPRSAARVLLDSIIPVVHAAEPEKPPRQPATPPQQATAPQGHPTPSQNHLTPSQVRAATRPAPNATRIQAANSSSASQPVIVSPLLDDLIYANCSGKDGCFVLGRTGRIYRITSNFEWGFRQARFNVTGGPAKSLSLLYAGGRERILAKSDNAIYRCSEVGPIADISTSSVSYLCSLEPGLIAATDDNFLKVALPNGKSTNYSEGYSIAGSNEVIFMGDAGVIFKGRTPQGGSTKQIPSGTSAGLLSSTFSSTGQGFIVGDHGIILSSNDGGETWRHETQGPEGGKPDHRLPALWYWLLAFILVVTCSVAVATPVPPPATEFSVADWAVTDAPLKPGDLDSLDFTPMAMGLSRFIRNPKTQPPVTIAIEGEWGEGKSSVMGLLRGDLEKSRFRPVWFNAWHHQSEEQLLAALLEHIKDEAVPPWWHIDNWIFRTRLLRLRFKNKWPLMILLIVALCGSVAYELSRHGLKLEDFAKFARDVLQLIKYLLPWSSVKSLPDDLGHFGLVATVLAMFAAIFSKAKTFGIDPSKLTDNLRNAAAIKDVKPEPGIRRQFSQEFGDLCKAWCWGGRRVIIFIDDLDRCRPESVVTVLESINFLTTAGDCMIVLGMAQRQVTHCVGLSFKEIAQAEEAYRGGGKSEQEQAIARFNYGAFYIKKLVNIIAPLPKTTQEQRRRVLDVRAAEARRQDEQQKASGAARWRMGLWDWLNKAGQITFAVAPVVALGLAVGLAVYFGYKQGSVPTPSSATTAAISQPSNPPATATTPATSDQSNNKLAKPLVYDRPTMQPATLAEADKSAAGGVWWSYGVDALFLLILFGILAYQLSARTNQDAQNSPDFEKSLNLWGPYIVEVCDTPREIKRALNDLRYQAMTRRNNGPSATRGERLLRTLRQVVTGRPEKMPVEMHVDEAALPPRKAAELANLTTDEWGSFLDPEKLDIVVPDNLRRLTELKTKHLKEFGRWIDAATLTQQSADEIATESNAARAAGQN